MKQYLLIIILLLSGLCAEAQMQKGYIKTLGRPNQKGVALNGVTVRVKGGLSAVLSKDDGTFSVQIQGESYALQQVQKSGYELNEKGVIGKKYAYSVHVQALEYLTKALTIDEKVFGIEHPSTQSVKKNIDYVKRILAEPVKDSKKDSIK